MVILRKKVCGSTLVETLVAMVIIMICFGIGTMIYSNVISSINLRERFHAQMILNEILMQSKKENIYIDQEYEIDNLQVKKKINRYKEANDLLQITLLAYNNKGALMAQHKEIIFTPK